MSATFPPGSSPSAAPRGVRRPARAVPLTLAVLGGALLPAQFAANGALVSALGSVPLTGAASYLTGTLLLAAVLGVQLRRGGPRPDWRGAALTAPRWAWLGGAVGSAYVVGSVVLTRALGAALATTLVIAAQLVTAVLLDHLGALGLPRRPVNRARAAAVACALAALALRFWGVR